MKTGEKTNQDVRKLIFGIANGNPGCIKVLVDLVAYDALSAFIHMTFLKDLKTPAPNIWIFYKDVHKEDIRKFSEGLDDFFLVRLGDETLADYMRQKHSIPADQLEI